MDYQNCWEFKQCGRECVSSPGVCPAALASAADGVNRGLNAGRVCWAVTGTLCDGERQGTYAEKVMKCNSCDFRLKVREEMSYKFKPIFFDKIAASEPAGAAPRKDFQPIRSTPI